MKTRICPHPFHVVELTVYDGSDDVEQELLRCIWANRVEPHGCGEKASGVVGVKRSICTHQDVKMCVNHVANVRDLPRETFSAAVNIPQHAGRCPRTSSLRVFSLYRSTSLPTNTSLSTVASIDNDVGGEKPFV